MLAKRGVVLLCVIAIAGAGVGVRLSPGPSRADVNGDRRVDVLDMQQVIAAVLQGETPDNLGDVNGDGQVDILDFQQVLSHVAQPAQEEKTSRDTSVFETCQFAYQTVWLVAPQCRKDERFVEEARGASCTGFDRPVRPSIPSETERYLFSLTPHAPPCA